MAGRIQSITLVLPVLLFLTVGARAQQGSVATDTAALEALYAATDGANWTDNTNWTSTEALSSWHGVSTNGDGRVTALMLNNNGLDGTLSAALGDLSELEQLDLQDNALSGALPSELTNLTSLTSLLLNESRALTGSLPDGLRELSDLATVNIETTELCAPEDDAFQTWLDTITFGGLICPPAEQSVIDVAVFYTPAARENTGGTHEIATAIDLMVAETNAAYEASDANQRINLVAVEEVVGYRETDDLRTDVFRLRSESDGYMDEVHDIRDTVAADIVLLIAAGLSGRAFQLSVPSASAESSAFGVANALSASTFAHELGHIMGIRHDRYAQCGSDCDHFTLFPYAFGYVNQEALEPGAPDTAFWRTIMAYPNQCGACPTILRFSNPDQLYPDSGGDPLGKAGLEPAPGADGPADAVRMLNRTRGYVANYRTAKAITVSFDAETYTATEGGTAATVTIRLSGSPGRVIDIPVTAASTTGAAASDYTVPTSVAFAANDTQKTFTITAVDDAVDDDGETVTLTLGHLLPGGVSAGSPATATVTLTDNDTVAGAPSILEVFLSSDPGGGYAAGEEVEAAVRFDKTVTVTGQPQLGLTVGSATRQALYQGAAREVVTFAYEVVADETDEDGVSIAANALTRNGGTIRDSGNRNASLTHDALAAAANHRVDGVKPVLHTAVVDETILTLTYDEPLAQPAPRASAFFTVAVTHPGGGRDAPSVVVDGSVMTVTLWEPVLAGEEVTVKFSNHATPAFGTPHLIRDLAGNPADSLRSHAVTNVTKVRPYDTDGDGLIEITTLGQLDAVRHDRNGDGVPTAAGASTYRAAFPDAFQEADSQLRCVLECQGYELMADLDFDTDDDGDVDSDDAYWNNGAGWDPIGTSGADFLATFEGNGHTVRNLFIDRPSTNYVGLFGYTDWKANISHVGLIHVNVAGRTHVGSLVGNNLGIITACYATGQLSGLGNVGGLVGINYSTVRTSYAAVRVLGSSAVGGLVGKNQGVIIDASYATGAVAGRSSVGGLVGYDDGNTVRRSYATGRVSGSSNVGGLVGGLGSGTITASYWDTTTSGQTAGDHGSGQTSAQLQAPTDNTGIYVDWDADQWDFGETGEYPALVVDFDGNGDATWEEFGYQLRDGPVLTTATDSSQSKLTWTAVDVSTWDPEPVLTYSVIRDDGTDVEAIASGLAGRAYTDSDVVGGGTYTYQVAAGVGTGEASRSEIVEVTVATTDLTAPSIESIESGATHPTKDPFTVTITFSESVTDLMASEVSVTNGTGSSFSGSGATYTLRVTPNADFDGDVTVSVPAGAAKDGANHLSESGSATFAVDTIVPALLTSGAATVNGATVTLTFDESLVAVNTAASAFTVTGGATRTISGVSVSGVAVQLTVSPPILHGETGIEVDYSAPSRDALADAAGNKVASFQDQAVANETPASTVSSEAGLSLDTVAVAEEGAAKTVVVTGTLNRSARPTATDMTVEVGAAGDTATEGADYTTVDDLTLAIPAYQTSATARFILRPANDRIDEQDESLTVTGSTTVSGLTVTPSGGLSIDITDNDAAPSLELSVSALKIDEDGGAATVTAGTGSGSTFETAQTVRLAVAGTATEVADYTISGKTLTLPAGMGTSASTVTATLTGVDDEFDDDEETVVISATHNGVAFGDRRTVTIEDDDDPEVTVSFAQAGYRAAEGGHVDVAVTLSAVPERQVSIPVEAEGADGADSADFSISPSSLSFGVTETTKTVRLSAVNDSAVDPGESVALSFGTPLPDRVSEGSVAQATVTIRDEDFTFVPAIAPGSGATEPEAGVVAVDEDKGALRLTLELATPRGVRVEDIPDPVVVTLATRENAGTREADEDYATQRRSGTFGDYGAYSRDVSFAPADFSDDSACGCATAEKSVSVDLYNDRVYERTEVLGLRLSRKTGRLSVSSQDITVKIGEDDAEPALTFGVDPATIAEAGGTSVVTVSTGTGSTFPTAQTIRLDLSGTATQGSDYTIDSRSLTLPAGVGQAPSSVTTTVRALDDPVDDDSETVILAASRDAVEFARRTVGIDDDDAASTRVDLSVNPAQVREDAAATTVQLTASLNAGARAQDTEVTVTVGSGGDSAVEGTDYAMVPDLILTIDEGETVAETTFSLTPTNNDSAQGTKTVTVDGSVSGLTVRSADLTLNDEPDAWDGELHVSADERPDRGRDRDDFRERQRRGADGHADRAGSRG